MKLKRFEIGQRYFQATIYKNDQDIDNSDGDMLSTREEAEHDGQMMRDGYDSEWQKKHPNCITYGVTEYQTTSVGDNGEWEGATSV